MRQVRPIRERIQRIYLKGTGAKTSVKPPVRPAAPTLPSRFHWIGVRKDPEQYGYGIPEDLVSLPPSELSTHALVIGATGSGKTNLLHHLIAQDILLGHSFVILDLRGDLISAALKLATGRVNPAKVGLFDLRQGSFCAGFNPLVGPGEPFFRALAVLEAVAAESDSWGIQLAETMRNAVLLLAEMGEPLTGLEPLLYSGDYRTNLVRRTGNATVQAFWERYDELSADRQAALATPVLNKVSMLFSTPTLRRTFEGSPHLDLGKHLDRRGSATLVSLAADELHGAGRMYGNLMLAALCREIFARVSIDESARNPVRLYVDEFEHFNSTLFESILAEGRRFKLSLVLAHQTLAQLTPTLRSLILNNVGTKVVFRTGRGDESLLSKDLVGDAKELSLTDLPVGEAMLWRRSQDLLHIEVNRPIVSNGGKLDAATQAFIERVRAAHSALSPQESAPATPPKASSKQQAKKQPSKAAHSLEEWL